MRTDLHYSILGPEVISQGEYSISSVQYSDAEPIRLWRNEQISALRQEKELSKESQERYFNNIINIDFAQKKPTQILVRFCHKDQLIGYGGIVHLDWANLRGEVSFLLNTERTRNHVDYARELNIFFGLIKGMAFKKLGLNKLTTEAYAHRKYHVEAIESAGFKRDGVLRQHTRVRGEWVDAVVASCLQSEFINS